MNPEQSKAGAVRIVVAVVVVLVAAIGVAYFTSDVWRTRIDAAADQYAHWTPENIAKDPENYLDFCEKEANRALVGLKASEISLAQNRASLGNTLGEAKSKIQLGAKALGELKNLYTQGEAGGSWPLSWQGRSLDADGAKRQIVALHRQVAGQENLLAKVEAGLRKVDVQLGKVLEARTETQNQLAEIRTSREILKVEKLTDELTDRLASIKGVLQATIGSVGGSEGPVTLEELAEQSALVVDDMEFNEIMAE